jgi:hypothetical protein
MIRNYINPATGLISLITSTSVSAPVKVFTSSTTGGPISGGVTGRENAVTTIALCNTAAPDPANEATNSVTVNVYIVAAGLSYDPANLVVSELVIPAGETVFFSEERMVLSSADEIWIGTSSAAKLAVTVSVLAV